MSNKNMIESSDGFVTLSEMNEAGEKPIFVTFASSTVEFTYDQSEYVPELERQMNEAQKDGRPGGMLSMLLMKLLRSWKVKNGPDKLTLRGRVGKFERDEDGLVKRDAAGRPTPEGELVIGPGEIIPLTERILDQKVGVFAMNKIVKAIIEDQRPNEENSPSSGNSW